MEPPVVVSDDELLGLGEGSSEVTSIEGLWPWDDNAFQKTGGFLDHIETDLRRGDFNQEKFNKLLHEDTQGVSSSHVLGDGTYEFNNFIQKFLIHAINYIRLCCNDKLGSGSIKSGIICGKDRHLSIAHGLVPKEYDAFENDEKTIREFIRNGIKKVLHVFVSDKDTEELEKHTEELEKYLNAYRPGGAMDDYYVELYGTKKSQEGIAELHDLHKASLIGHSMCEDAKQGAHNTELQLRWNSPRSKFGQSTKRDEVDNPFEIFGVVGHTPIPFPFFGNNQLCCDTTYTTKNEKNPLNRLPMSVLLNTTSKEEWVVDVVFDKSYISDTDTIFPCSGYFLDEYKSDTIPFSTAWELLSHYHINNEICKSFFHVYRRMESKNNTWRNGGDKIFIGQSWTEPYPYIVVEKNDRKWNVIFYGIVKVEDQYTSRLQKPEHSISQLMVNDPEITRLIITDIEGNWNWMSSSLVMGQYFWRNMGDMASQGEDPINNNLTVLYCGDTWDRGNTEYYGHIFSALEDLHREKKLVCVCGNRDINKLRFLLEYIKNPLFVYDFLEAVKSLRYNLLN